MKFDKFCINIIVLLLSLTNFYFSMKIGLENKPIDFVKNMGFRCVGETTIEAAVRINNNNDVECWSENGKDCTWGLNSEAKCLSVIDPKNLSKLNPVSCGVKHKLIHGTNGYDVPGHWCNKALKHFFGKWHCPLETGLKETIIMDKDTGEIKCLSKDLITCYTGKDAQSVCEGDNECKKKKEENKKKSFFENSAPPQKDEKNQIHMLGCEGNNVDKEGHAGYQEPGKHWCKDALAFFRYSGNWLLNSETGLNNIIRLGKKGDVECLSKDGSSCLEERGGDIRMKDQIDNATNGGKAEPKVIECGKDQPKGKTGFEDPTKWCYKAYYSVLGKSLPKDAPSGNKPGAGPEKPAVGKDGKPLPPNAAMGPDGKQLVDKDGKPLTLKPATDIDGKPIVDKDGKPILNAVGADGKPALGADGKPIVAQPAKGADGKPLTDPSGKPKKGSNSKPAVGPDGKPTDDKSAGKPAAGPDGKPAGPDGKPTNNNTLAVGPDGKPIKPKKSSKKKKSNKPNPKTDFPWRGSVFGPNKDGFGGNVSKSHRWRGEDLKDADDDKANDADKPETPKKSKPGWRNIPEEQLGNEPPKTHKIKAGEKWRNGVDYKKFNISKKPKKSSRPHVKPEPKPKPAPGTPLVYEIISNKNNKCLQVAKDSKEAGAQIIQQACNQVESQKWEEKKLDNGNIVLNSILSHLALSVEKDGKEDGDKLVQIGYAKKPSQEFIVTKEADGSSSLKAAHSQMCVDITSGSDKDGATIIQWKCNNGDNQKWKLHVVPKESKPEAPKQPKKDKIKKKKAPDSSEVYEIVSSLSNMCLEVKANGKFQGANIVQNKCKHSRNQRFEISQSPTKTLIMKVQSTELALSVWGGGLHDFANFVQADFIKGTHQEFTLKKQKNKDYEIKAMNSGKCLVVEGDSKKVNANILQFTCNGKLGQTWKMVKVSGNANPETFLIPDIPGKNKPEVNGVQEKPSCVTMYQDTDYKGDKKEICGDIVNFVSIGFNDRASSIKVPKGTQVDLFWDIEYKGKSVRITEDTPSLVKIGFNDKASSAKVAKAAPQSCVTLFADTQYKGASKEICGEIPNFVPLGFNDKVSSIKVPKGSQVDLFEDVDFKGAKITITEDNADFTKLPLSKGGNWNDKASSAKVFKNLSAQGAKPTEKRHLEEGTYQIISVNSNKCADVSGASKNDGAIIHQWKCHGGKNQDWVLTYNADNMAIFTGADSKKLISVDKAGKSKGVGIVQLSSASPNKDHQFWKLKPVDGVFQIINLNSGKCFDVSGASKNDGAKIHQWDCHAGPNQKWKFVLKPGAAGKKKGPNPAPTPAPKPVNHVPKKLTMAQKIAKKAKAVAKKAVAAVKNAVSKPKPVSIPIYRYWQPQSNDHFYTTNVDEIGTSVQGKVGKYGYHAEGIAGHCSKDKFEGAIPMYRYYSPGSKDHFYTTNAGEIGTTQAGATGKYGYKSEGILCYVWPAQASYKEGKLVPLYRYWKAAVSDHFYTVNANEIGTVQNQATGKYGYKSEGIAAWIMK